MAIYNVDGKQLNGLYSDWRNNGVLNAVNTVKQLCRTGWTTVNSGMPAADDTRTYSEGQTITGMPYSSASIEDGYIGINVSLYTFMCAIHNPRSVLYTEKSLGYTGYAYYGTVCTSLVCAAWGIPCLITTVAFQKCNDIVKVAFEDLELGDMLLSGTHAKIISGIERDSNGNIVQVQTSESKYTHCVMNEYVPFSEFGHTGYGAYRYKYIESNDYKPSPYLRLHDEPTSDVNYPDIMSCFGDKVTRKHGTDIIINVLDNEGYDVIEVYKDGVLIDRKTAIEDFTMAEPAVGSYEVRMTGTEKSSSTYFDIVDCSMEIVDNTLNFHTTYKAVAVGGFPIYTVEESGKATTWNNPMRIHLVDDTENVQRKIDIEEMLLDGDCDGGVRLYVQGVYGIVSFEHKYN